MSEQKKKPALEPVMICVWGASGGGKTTDLMSAFPTGDFVAPQGALQSSIPMWGFLPKRVDKKHISDATEYVTANAGKVFAIIMDEFSFMSADSISRAEAKSKSGADQKMWGIIRDELIEFREACRRGGAHIVVNCQERPAGEVKGGWKLRAGPQLPGRMPEELPALSDMSLQASTDLNRWGPWKGVYRCPGEKDTTKITKDRLMVCAPVSPMNLRELLNAAGYVMPRLPGLEWQDEVAEYLSKGIESGVALQEAIKAGWAAAAARSSDPRHIAWAVRDGVDRAAVRMSAPRNLIARSWGI